MTKYQAAMDELNKLYHNLNPDSTRGNIINNEWSDDPNTFNVSAEPWHDGDVLLFDYYQSYMTGHPKAEAILKKYNLTFEWYDPGTVIVFGMD